VIVNDMSMRDSRAGALSRGVIRILDIAFLAKDRDGSLSGMEVGGGLNQLAAAFAEFEGGRRPVCSARTTCGRPPPLSATVSRAGRPSAGSNRGSYPYGQPEPAYAEQQPAYEAAVQPPPPAAPEADPIQLLKDLAALRDQGVLTDEEFEMQKARVLGG
jgi:hypothetical protein